MKITDIMNIDENRPMVFVDKYNKDIFLDKYKPNLYRKALMFFNNRFVYWTKDGENYKTEVMDVTIESLKDCVKIIYLDEKEAKNKIEPLRNMEFVGYNNKLFDCNMNKQNISDMWDKINEIIEYINREE